MVKKVKFRVAVFDSGDLKYAAGTVYPLDPVTQRQVDRGNAELIDAEDKVEARPAAKVSELLAKSAAAQKVFEDARADRDAKQAAQKEAHDALTHAKGKEKAAAAEVADTADKALEAAEAALAEAERAHEAAKPSTPQQ